MPQDTQLESTSTENEDLKHGRVHGYEELGIGTSDIDLDRTAQEDIILELAGPGPVSVDNPDEEENSNLGAGDSNADTAKAADATSTETRSALTALPVILAAAPTNASPSSTGDPAEQNESVGVGPHSSHAKAARIEQLIAEGKKQQAMTLVHSMVREQARRAVRRADGERIRQTRDPAYFLDPEWRAQWSGQDIVAIAHTLAKGVYKGDTSGKAVVDDWHDRIEAILLRQPDSDMAAIEISQMIVIKEGERNAAYRRSLANGLTEIQVQVAEITGGNAHEYVRPIRVADLGDIDGASAPMVEETDGEGCASAPEAAT